MGGRPRESPPSPPNKGGRRCSPPLSRPRPQPLLRPSSSLFCSSSSGQPWPLVRAPLARVAPAPTSVRTMAYPLSPSGPADRKQKSCRKLFKTQVFFGVWVPAADAQGRKPQRKHRLSSWERRKGPAFPWDRRVQPERGSPGIMALLLAPPPCVRGGLQRPWVCENGKRAPPLAGAAPPHYWSETEQQRPTWDSKVIFTPAHPAAGSNLESQSRLHMPLRGLGAEPRSGDGVRPAFRRTLPSAEANVRRVN